MSDRGRKAYHRYREAVGGKTFDGKPMLEFDEMPERIRAGWDAAADVETFTLHIRYPSAPSHDRTYEVLK